jgi:hypothetical protein
MYVAAGSGAVIRSIYKADSASGEVEPVQIANGAGVYSGSAGYKKFSWNSC